MGSRRDVVVLATVVVALLLVYLATVPGSLERSASDPRLSTYRFSPQGGLALRLLVEETGVSTDRRRTPLTGEPLPGALAILAPVRTPTPGEVSVLMSWLREGGRLVYVPGSRAPVLDSLGLATVSLVEDDFPMFQPTRPRGVAAIPAGHRWTKGIDSVAGVSRALTDLPDEATVLLESRKGQPVAALLRVGAGRALLVADPEPLRNRSLRESGAALLMARAARELGGEKGALVFDEYHHGYRAASGPVGATLEFLGATPLGRATAQLLVLGLVALLVAGRRFGTPVEHAPTPRRSPTEHVTALAAALRRAGARETVRNLLLDGVARRLGRPPPSPTESDRATFLEWLASRPRAGEAARAFAGEWRRGRKADLAALARHADRIIELEGAT